MERQRNMSPMKEQEKSPEKKKKVNEMQVSNLQDIEFKKMVIRIFKELRI